MALMCDECGSRDVRRAHLYGRLVEECGLCGHLQGDPGDVERVQEIREAEALGVAPELVGLMRVLESIDGVVVDRHLSTAAGHALPPALYFNFKRHPLELLDRLARSLLLASRHLSTLWVLEATHQGRLLFVLKPRALAAQEERPRALPAAGDRPRTARLDPAGLHPVQPLLPLHPLVRDMGVLRDALQRDIRLPWWEVRT